MRRGHALCIAIALATSVAGPARATVRDGQPWDWSDYASLVERNARNESKCDTIAENLQIADLKCEIDHDSWDRFLKAETQKPALKRLDSRSPWDCGYSYDFFRDRNSSGSVPSKGDPDGAPVTADFQKKLKVLSCVMENSEKPRYLTYDPAKKMLVVHITRALENNNSWMHAELKKLKGVFPAINNYWDAGYN